MNIQALLFKDSDCDICKLIQEEFTENPLACDLTIHHVKHNYNTNLVEKYNIETYPTTILVYADSGEELTRFEGFVCSAVINNYLSINNFSECI